MKKQVVVLTIIGYQYVDVGTMKIMWLQLLHIYHLVIIILKRQNYYVSLIIITYYCIIGSCTSLSAITDSLDTSAESISAIGLEEAFRYSLKRLLRGEPTSIPTDAICSLRIFYKVSQDQKPICRQLINSTLNTLKAEYRIVATVVPVLHLHHPNTFVSVCALRHNT